MMCGSVTHKTNKQTEKRGEVWCSVWQQKTHKTTGGQERREREHARVGVAYGSVMHKTNSNKYKRKVRG